MFHISSVWEHYFSHLCKNINKPKKYKKVVLITFLEGARVLLLLLLYVRPGGGAPLGKLCIEALGPESTEVSKEREKQELHLYLVKHFNQNSILYIFIQFL